MLKIALNAGHGMNTAGKRCDKRIDPNETRENWLNRRICDLVEYLLKSYEGYELIRVDDTTGAVDVTLANRVSKANKFKADIYISIHHNAGIYYGNGGGIMAFTYTKVDDTTKSWQKSLYDALIKHTGLKGNRATPITSANFYELQATAMPAVLLELGFMDSKTDTPIILTEDYAVKCAKAIVEVIVAKGGLTNKTVEITPTIDVSKYEAEIKSLQNRKAELENEVTTLTNIVKSLENKLFQIRAILG